MTRAKLLIGGLIGLVVLAAAGGYYYWQETRPVDKRGSAQEQFDSSAEPGEAKPAKRIAEPWPTYGYDLQRTKVSPYDHRPPFRTRWRLDGLDTLEFPPSAAYGNVYLAQQKGLFFALNGRTGKPVFKRKNFKRCAASSPTLANGTIYQAYMDFEPCPQDAADPTGFIVAMDARSGREKWRFRTQPVESSPLLRNGNLYFGSWDGNVYSIDAETGKEKWSFDTGAKVNTSAAYYRGTVYIANDDGNVYALNAGSGELVWQASSQSRFGAREFFYASPTIAYGRVYIGNTDGTMLAFGAKSGDLLWSRPLGTYIYSSAAVDDRRVFVGTYDGKFFALDAATGDTKWERDLPAAGHSPPVVMGGLVYTAACSTCGSEAARYVKMSDSDASFAFDVRTGKTRWRNTDGKYASPIIADQDRVYLTGRSFLYGLAPRREAERAGQARRRGGRRELARAERPRADRSRDASARRGREQQRKRAKRQR